MVVIGDKGVANYFLVIEKGSLFFFQAKGFRVRSSSFWNGCFIDVVHRCADSFVSGSHFIG